MPTLADLGFEPTDMPAAGRHVRGARALEAFAKRIKNYAKLRDFPVSDATSGLSVHLRFGTRIDSPSGANGTPSQGRGPGGLAVGIDLA